jgi:hypothetical protein
MAVGPLGDAVISSGSSGTPDGFQLSTRTPAGRWSSEQIDTNLRAGEVLVNGAGDAIAFSSADASNTQEQVYVSALEAPADRPAIRVLRLLPRDRSSSPRLRIVLSAAGRAVLSLNGANSRVVLGAWMVQIGPRGALVDLPERLADLMRRPGVYRITVDTGRRSAAAGRKSVVERIG